jgi:CheY-like chemotaxis protein
MRVLVVDNDARLRRLLALVLGQLGFTHITQAADGSAAILALSDGPLDLIVTDLQMPHMDGIGLVRRLREGGDRTPVIMVSGQTDPKVIALARQAGVDHYLTKPVDANALSDAIQQAPQHATTTHKPSLSRKMVSRQRRPRTARRLACIRPSHGV